MPKYRVKRHAVTQPLDPSYRLIPLTRNQNAIVDASDYEWLNQWNWCATWVKNTKSFAAVRRVPGVAYIYMSRLIVGCGPNEEADHWNHDTLDNRRQNLRNTDRSHNKANTRKYSTNKSGFKGVSWEKRYNRWRSVICVNKTVLHIGLFRDKEKAAIAYDEAATKHFGEFAFLNFPNHKS